MAIKRRGSKFIVTSKSGRVLGTHNTRKAALKQLGAVEASKSRRNKGRKK